MGKTLVEKIWNEHVVFPVDEDTDAIYIDKHFIHEVTSPQAFAGIERRGVRILRTDSIVATADHNVPTENQHLPIRDEMSRKQVEQLVRNCASHGIELFGMGHPYQGIVHVIGPELGLTLPGMTIVCGDSHTSTHGAFGCIAFGIGTSEVEQVFATQCLIQSRPKNMRITVNGKRGKGVTAKDIILYIISQVSAGGASGYFVEYDGEVIRSLSMEERMTVCNMSIEMGARGGLIAPDEVTFQYLQGKKFVPADFETALDWWSTLYSDTDAVFDKEITINASGIEPMVTYGTNPGMSMKITGVIPGNQPAPALDYMGFHEGEGLLEKKIDYVFIGSCTNSRIEDLRAAATVIKGRKKSKAVTAWIVPGSRAVAKQAVREGLDKIFTAAGFEFRQPGCSSCLGMNEDRIPEGKYCVSTSNRNFEGRQGPGARTILASPLTAAASAITGKLTDIRTFQ